MNEFIEQTLEEYFASSKVCEIINGHTMTRFTVFIDFETALLTYQYTYFNQNSEQLEMDYEPSNERFLCFYRAYEGVEKHLIKMRQDATYYDVIPEMEKRFVEYAVSKGYREEILFTIMYVPIDLDDTPPLLREANLLAIPPELLLQARDRILRN